MVLLGICDLFWLFWLLCLLLGMLLAWLYWQNKYNKMVTDYDAKIKGLNSTINGLDADLTACIKKRNDLEGDLAITKGIMREMEARMMNRGGTGMEIKDASESLNDLGIESTKAEMNIPNPSKSMFSGVKPDNLQIIEGIGPKMESILKENGIHNFSNMAGKSTEDIQTILNKYGDKYKIIDPKTWVQQAQLANSKDYNGLINLQKKLDAGKDNAVGLTNSKLEKYLIKIGALKAFKQDDLQAIEGIGPATDKLLRGKGINTWRDLANTSADDIKAFLKEGGSRFSLGDPTTWPRQAELAADGKFDELKEYQDFLDGGKE